LRKILAASGEANRKKIILPRGGGKSNPAIKKAGETVKTLPCPQVAGLNEKETPLRCRGLTIPPTQTLRLGSTSLTTGRSGQELGAKGKRKNGFLPLRLHSGQVSQE